MNLPIDRKKVTVKRSYCC